MADQGFLLNGSNANYDYRYRSVWGDTDVTSGFRLTYNGAPVVYVPKEWANRGSFFGGNQYLVPGYLNKDAWQYLKPATLEPGKWNETLTSRLSGIVNNPLDGYIIDEKKFQELKLDKSQQTPRWTSSGKPNPPITNIGDDNGKLVYVGKSGDDRNGELVVFNETGSGNLYAHTSESSFWGDIGRSLGKLGPATLLLNAAIPGLGTAIYAGTQIGQGIATGNFGKAALNLALMSVPGAEGTSIAKDTIFEIPGIANSVKTISDTLGVSAAVAGGVVNTTINLLANGGNLTDAIKTSLAQQVGEGASQFASQIAGLQGMKGLDTILKSVVKQSTTAALLNQDVGEVAKNAFVNSSIPLALQTTPGWEKLTPAQQKAMTSTAIAAVQGGKMDISSALRNYAGEVFVQGAEKYLPTSMSAQQKQLALDTIKAGIQGKPLDKALQTAMLSEAKTAVANQVAQAEGWETDAQKQTAIKQYGSKVKPQEYIAKQQGWEDYAAKQAAIKSYGETITPLGFKERELVKSVDPKFDAEAYAKLNEVSGDPFQHFLEQGKKAQLPTNYESGAEKALASLGYKADQTDIKEVADLLKTSSNPDAALSNFYDQRWVSPEEAQAVAKEAGFELSPEQLAKFTGQARAGQTAVFEDIGLAASIGKSSQQQRETFINNYINDVTKSYKDQGYSDAEIAAVIPDIRARLGKTADDYVSQLQTYTDQVRTTYGPQSKEFAEAQKKLLDAKSSMGGYGVVRESDGYKSVTGEFIPMNEPQSKSTWIQDVTRKPQAPSIEGDRLLVTGGIQGPSAATEAIRKEFAAIGVPGQTPPVLSSEGAQKSALVGEIPSGSGDGKVPTLFGIPLSATFADVGSDSWVRVNQDTWVTPDNKYTFLSLPGGGEVRDTQTKNIVAKLTPQETAKISPPAPATLPSAPQEQLPKAVQDIIKAADEKRISPQEAQKALQDAMAGAGYKATPEEIQQQVAMLQGERTPEQLQEEITKYLDPRMVTKEEVKQMYRDLGLMEPTEEDIARFVGQRSQTELPDILKPYLPTASANVVARTMEAQQLAAKEAADKAAALQAKAAEESAAAQSALQAKITLTDQKLADFAVQTGQNFSDLKGQFDLAFKDAQAKGASADAALQTAINKVATDAAANQKATGEQIGKLGADVGSVQSSLSQLGTTTQAQFSDVNARIDQLQKQGMSQAEATSQALRELSSGQAQTAQQIAANQQTTQTQIGDLNSRIAQLQQQGLSQTEATNKALAELSSGQAGLGQQIGSLQSGLGQALQGLVGQFGATTQGLQKQIGQAQQQAAMGNLLTIIGLGQQQQQPAAPIPLVGTIKPYEFTSDLLQGVYGKPASDIYNSNASLINLLGSK